MSEQAIEKAGAVSAANENRAMIRKLVRRRGVTDEAQAKALVEEVFARYVDVCAAMGLDPVVLSGVRMDAFAESYVLDYPAASAQAPSLSTDAHWASWLKDEEFMAPLLGIGSHYHSDGTDEFFEEEDWFPPVRDETPDRWMVDVRSRDEFGYESDESPRLSLSHADS